MASFLNFSAALYAIGYKFNELAASDPICPNLFKSIASLPSFPQLSISNYLYTGVKSKFHGLNSKFHGFYLISKVLSG
jgi:hypothetical protein